MKKSTTKPMFSKQTMALYTKACKALKVDPVKAKVTAPGMPEKHLKSVIAYGMLCLIHEFINKQIEWEANFFTKNTKYWTWDEVKADEKRPSGFGFSISYYDCSDAGADTGSRLYFGSAEDEKKWRKPLEELRIAFKL